MKFPEMFMVMSELPLTGYKHVIVYLSPNVCHEYL